VTAARSSPWFAVPSPNRGARVTLFCIPYAGSGASCYHAWSRALAGQPVEVRAVQLPGRENRLRETPFREMAPLVLALADQIEPFLDRPYCVFGHSMGALVAFELARELSRRGRPGPARLFASGANAPHVPSDEEPLHQLPDAELVRAVSERYEGIPRQVLEHRELLELVLPALRADLTAIETYEFRDGARLQCAISAFAGEGDRHVTPAKLAPWQDVTDGPFASALFAGDHFYLNDQRAELINVVLPELLRIG
jgi:medium-chain acyl-[acyl-carrier-protein] hydrolase